ncbi:phosphohistidine phosphatase [Sphingobacterium alkalisoli]|uniref:Phosphohistidine phosphatase n=1 Tax=Sphingobacterium alkalisoli TaxID=1874115 RepID=A0A4U0GYF0_9SPHI|nr:histidine phosphatase family protein [Sphingobacterium alkalisoli]TJY64235.1 phosphohistidine phosphatase [Sphingobacterium alkalisoli]GGH23002.1 phosphohistidine phosphatase SixA [Sphingobacterium alkalisoli]
METKSIYIVRHAKAEDHSLSKRDFNRDLINKGKERAHRIATELAPLVTVNEKTLVISSPANRAIQTAEIFCSILGYPAEKIQMEINIYEAHYLDILRVINNLTGSYESIWVFGHNPGLSDLTNYLCDSQVDLLTANVAIIGLENEVDFASLAGSTGNLKTVLDGQ